MKPTEIDKKMYNTLWMRQWIDDILGKGKKQIKKELEDYWSLMKVHSEVLNMITNGKISKTNYTLEAIKKVYYEELDKLIKERIK